MNKIVTISLAPVMDWFKIYLKKTRISVITNTKNKNPARIFSKKLVMALNLYFIKLSIGCLPRFVFTY